MGLTIPSPTRFSFITPSKGTNPPTKKSRPKTLTALIPINTDNGPNIAVDKKEKTFFLNEQYIKARKTDQGYTKWRMEGNISLPPNENYTKLVIDSEIESAKEIKTLNLSGNPVKNADGSELLSGVEIINCANCHLEGIPSTSRTSRT